MNSISSVIYNTQACFSEKLLNTLTSQQKKVAAVAMAIFSAVIFVCCIFKFTEIFSKSKVSPKIDDDIVAKLDPKKEAPKAEPKKEAPKAEPKKEAPKAEPKKEAPKAEPKKEAPKAEPKKEAPKAEPKKEAPKVDKVDGVEKLGESDPLAMKVSIRNGGENYAIEIDLTKSVLDLKTQIFEEQDIEIERQRLIFGGQILNDTKTLESYKIIKDAVIILALKPKAV